MRPILLFTALLAFNGANASDFYDHKALTEQGETWAQFGIGSLITSAVVAGSYNRAQFYFQSYKPDTSIGFYTNQTCSSINIDHIVSLKDAHDSGASSWSTYKKRTFANDKANHVPSCGRVNSSKGSAGQRTFCAEAMMARVWSIRLSGSVSMCRSIYAVKLKYELSFANSNSADLCKLWCSYLGAGGVCCVRVIVIVPAQIL